jgi:chromosome partitioning protein
MQTITVANRKGGVAKTTTAVTLAHGLARANHRVLLIDLDSQGHCATALSMDPEPGVFDLTVTGQPVENLIRRTGRSGLDLLPSNSRTNTAAQIAQIEHLPIGLLATHLQPLSYEFHVIDTPPSGYFQEVALYLADILVLPAALDFLALDGVRAILDLAEAIGRQHGRMASRRLLLPVFADHTNESKYNLKQIQDYFGDIVADAVPRRVKVREATAAGQTIFEYAPGDDAASAYQSLIARLIGVDQQVRFGV